MLVRFLSYAASVIGAKRYKPLLISSLVLIFSITGISIVVSSLASGSSDAASRINQKSDDKSKTGQEQTSLGGLKPKSTKDEDAIKQQSSQIGSNAPNNNQQGGASPEAPVFDITLNASTISLSQANPNTAVTVTASDGNVRWSISPETTDGLSARIEQSKDNAGSAVIRFRTDNVTPGTYQFTVSAKSTNSTQGASKTISVTVN
jgi:hypothetical protein